MRKSFYSRLAKHSKCTYFGINPKTKYFEFSNDYLEQKLVIRFDDYPWQLGLIYEPSFINAELYCNKTGDTISYTTILSKANQLLQNI